MTEVTLYKPPQMSKALNVPKQQLRPLGCVFSLLQKRLISQTLRRYQGPLEGRFRFIHIDAFRVVVGNKNHSRSGQP
jgi:hypothetical protein